MKPLIVNQRNEIKNMVENYLKFHSRKTVFVFDIHKTTLTKDGEVNKQIYNLIKEILKLDYNVLFLSFDGNDKRIPENNKKIDKISLYRKIPRIFIKKRNKDIVVSTISNMIDFDSRLKYHVVLIDDNFNNIKDVRKLNNKCLIGYHYDKDNKDLKNLKKMFSFFKN